MTAILERRENSSLWARFCEWIVSTENRCVGMTHEGGHKL